MRYLAVLLTIFLFTACDTAPATRSDSPAGSTPPQGSIDPVVAFLLASAAKDFHTHGPSGSLRFREVRVGHLTTPSGEEQHMLCGQFLSEGKTEWTPFATIKTSGYEQWNGAQAESFCQRPSITWDRAGDLSSFLQTRLDSLPR
jgi:hypothetical protein